MIFCKRLFSILLIPEFLKELQSNEGADFLKELRLLFTLLAFEFVNFKGVLKVLLNLFPLALNLLADPQL